jgi:hypothetical protein
MLRQLEIGGQAWTKMRNKDKGAQEKISAF